MKYQFYYEDGKKIIFRDVTEKGCVSQADVLVPEHGIVTKIVELNPIKGFGTSGSSTWFELHNGLIGEVEETERGYSFNLFEPDEDGFRGNFYSGGTISFEKISNGSIFDTLDKDYGRHGSNFQERILDNIFINESSSFASVYENKIDFKFNVGLGSNQCSEIADAYGEINSTLCHVIIDKEAQISSIDLEFYLKDLTIVEKAGSGFLTESQIKQIEGYTKTFFIGREAEFSLDGNNEDISGWEFNHFYSDNCIWETIDTWIDERGNEFFVGQYTDAEDTWNYAKVISVESKEIVDFAVGNLKTDRESVMGMYEDELVRREIDRHEALIGEALDKEQALVIYKRGKSR